MKIDIKIVGVSPLICNRFSDEAALKASSGKASAMSNGNRGTPLEIAEKKLYVDLGGKFCIPQPNMMRSIVDGGKFFKCGKKQVTTKTESMLFACLDLDGTTFPIIHKQPWKVDTRAVRIPSTGGRILAHRPMFDDWALEFTADLDDDFLGESLFREICDAAGKRVGLGDFRPATKGPYGKYRVDSWKVGK